MNLVAKKIICADRLLRLLPTLLMLLLPLQIALAQELPDYVVKQFGEPPAIPTAGLSDDLRQAVELALVESVTTSTWSRDQQTALAEIAESGDPRLAWPVSDLMRFITDPRLANELAQTVSELLGITFTNSNYWGVATDHLMAWDIPSPPDYLRVKRAIFTSIVPGWEKLFVSGDIDWRHVSWGGVLIDDRAYNTTDAECNCIPAADHPPVTSATDASWLEDSDIVFGVEVNGEYRAYPRRIMEVREMINDTLGGRQLGIPYCTLCGSAQAYFTDSVAAGIEHPVLRTSGLLIRSNKVMYDIVSHSIFDTFIGTAVTGPLAQKNVQLQQASVVTSEWGAWKRAHPETTVVAESVAMGRDFDFRNNRDANGPIFPIGDVDPRLPVHEDVVGALTNTGKPVAFQRSKAMAALSRGESVEVGNLRLLLDGGGIKAVDKAGKYISSHQAFWFAWSQFHPETEVWPY